VRLRVRVHDVLAAPAVAARLLRGAVPRSFEVSDDPDRQPTSAAIRYREYHDSSSAADRRGRRLSHRRDAVDGGSPTNATDIRHRAHPGASPRRVIAYSQPRETVIAGWRGVGVVLGLALALHLDTIVLFCSARFRLPDPGRRGVLRHRDPRACSGATSSTIVWRRCCWTLATVYPAIRAARTAPPKPAALRISHGWIPKNKTG